MWKKSVSNFQLSSIIILTKVIGYLPYLTIAFFLFNLLTILFGGLNIIYLDLSTLTSECGNDSYQYPTGHPETGCGSTTSGGRTTAGGLESSLYATGHPETGSGSTTSGSTTAGGSSATSGSTTAGGSSATSGSTTAGGSSATSGTTTAGIRSIAGGGMSSTGSHVWRGPPAGYYKYHCNYWFSYGCENMVIMNNEICGSCVRKY